MVQREMFGRGQERNKALQQLLGWGMFHHPLTSVFLHLTAPVAHSLLGQSHPSSSHPCWAPLAPLLPEPWIAPHTSSSSVLAPAVTSGGFQNPDQAFGPHSGPGALRSPMQKHLQHHTHLQHFPSVPLPKHNLKIKQLCLKLREGITVICTLLSHLTDFCLLKDTVYHQY